MLPPQAGLALFFKVPVPLAGGAPSRMRDGEGFFNTVMLADVKETILIKILILFLLFFPNILPMAQINPLLNE
jgi:hypothetical protein